MTNFRSGRLVAQIFSHDVGRLLKTIYMSTVEPKKELNDFERGVLFEISNNQISMGAEKRELLNLCLNRVKGWNESIEISKL